MAPEILLPLGLVGSAYVAGWIRLSRRTRHRLPLHRLAVGLGALATIAAALSPPMDALAHELFLAHMVQHMLLMMVAAPALLLANPFPLVLWGCPAAVRTRAGRLLAVGAPLRAAWWALTWMPVAALVYSLTLWLWHWPPLYDRAVESPLVHSAEHLTFFAAAVLFWWPVVAPAPRLRKPPPNGLRVVYVILAAFQNAALGLLLAMSPPLYASYALTPARWGWSQAEDQAAGGIVMWGVTGAVDMLAVLVLLYRLLGEPARLPGSLTDSGGGATMERFET